MDYTNEQLADALRRADAAGDVEAARAIARKLNDQKSVDFSFGEMISNIPSSAVKYGSDIVSAVSNPMDTLKGVGGLAQEALTGEFAQELGRVFTGQGPSQDSISGAIHSGIKSRYGTADAAKQTLMNDPVGVLADVAGGTSLSGLKVGRALEPARAATKSAKAGIKATVPADKPVKMYQKAAKFSTTLDEGKRARIIQTALDEGVMPTAKGVKKVEGRIDILNHSLDDLIQSATANGTKIPVQAVFAHLKELRKTKGGFKIEGSSDLAAINKFAANFHKSLGGKKFVTPDELQAFKVDAYKKIAWDAKRMAGSPIKEDTFKAMARAAKDALSKGVPGADDINRQLGELYELQPHLTRAAGRVENRNAVGLTTPLNIGAGGYAGSVAGSPEIGFLAGTAAAVINNPKMQSRLAIALNKIKQGDIGWLEANKGAAEVRLALDFAGRLNDQLANQ